jgi:hypothetical protein
MPFLAPLLELRAPMRLGAGAPDRYLRERPPR